jgi:hypothetical protein
MARFGKNFSGEQVKSNPHYLMTGKPQATANSRSWWLFTWASCWSLFALLAALLTGCRLLMSSELVSMLETDDVPAISFFKENLQSLAYLVVTGSGLCLLMCVRMYRRWGTSWRGLSLWFALMVCGGLTGWEAIWALTDAAGFEKTKPGTILDWLRVLAFPVSSCLLLAMTGGRNWDSEEQTSRDTPWFYVVTFVLGSLSAFVYALADHVAFWKPAWNGDHHYERFFQDGETMSANLVLYSTSLLLASLVGTSAVIFRLTFRWLCVRESGRIGRWCPAQGRQALAVSVIWAISLSWPWLSKLWPDVASERAWILPVAATGFIFSILIGPIGITSKLIFRDELMKRLPDSRGNGASERTFLTATLFLLYPLLRWIPAKKPDFQRKWLLILGGITAGLMAWLAHEADSLFSFEDWRGMLKKSQLPYLRVYCSALLAFGVYLGWKRYIQWRGFGPEVPSESKIFRKERIWGRRLTGALLLLLVAGGSWPFWGWSNITENTFARTAEFSNRHRFELLSLHWLFDRDGDGYAGILHGADKDDNDDALIAGGMMASGPIFATEDAFEVDNPHKLQNAPNLVVLFLEGVTPEAISVYEKHSPIDKKTTPHLDALAKDGSLFLNARVVYPSTWDTWYGTISGRMLRIMEMSSSWRFGDRYSRLNNLRKILENYGIKRRCYPDAAGFSKLFLSKEERLANWQSDFDASLSKEDRALEITRGDKRLKRILEFVDDLEDGESFFISEHMADTHFPWNRTSEKRAKELGFPQGLAFAEKHGKTDKQKRYLQTITRMDGQIGSLMQRLKERGFYDKTCVVVVGDHGCQWYEHERGYYVSHLYEASIRIPLIIKLPTGKNPRPERINAPITPQDVLPTLCELGGVVHEPNETLGPLFGKSLLPLLDGREKPEGSERRRNRDLLLITHYDKLGILYQSRWKLIFDRPVGTYRLFDLKNDPEEMQNLADLEKEGMMKVLTKRLKEMAWKEHRAFIGGIRWRDETTTENDE